MVYVALLRGINVGGNNKVEMAKLKLTFEQLGFTKVKTYINSGNIIFEGPDQNHLQLASQIEAAITKDFGLNIPVVLRNLKQIQAICKAMPETWVNNSVMKCDVLFLWEEVDNKSALEAMSVKRDIVDLKYVPGAVIWRIDKENVTRGGIDKFIAAPIYKKITIRNCNTVRKLKTLMEEAAH
ncbi:DUF1697 domain-containing protein [Patescibacteria group bacterium]|nr:MAG: DUF1697 domain-containing protein [Patescibacteria group bacterium]